jgi:parvulin-like peptidyl-prolyl isomerase
MRTAHRLSWAALTLALACGFAGAQTPPTTPAAKPPVDPKAIAARVNGQPIYETAVRRALDRVPASQQAVARPEVLNLLMDNVLVEQYLLQLQVAVDKKDVDKRLEEFRAELKKANKDFDKVMKDYNLTEAELREQITADLRWDKFVSGLATEKALKDLFEVSREMFDGTLMHARHILITPPPNDPKADAKIQTDLRALRQQIEKEVADGIAQLPKDADDLAREKARTELIDKTFATHAKEISECPTKNQGGDVGWFQWTKMVEPFARAAFALKPYTMSDVVKSQFGYHLILVLDRQPGREIKFEDVKEEVREVFAVRVRDKVLAQYREKSRIEVLPAPK